ncbi:MAG: hypothetical protein QXG08_01205 [Candidatus Methanomethyliaceae archaeon]
MDKPIEAVMAFTAFLLAFSFVYALGSALYAAGINSHLSPYLQGIAETAASSIVLVNGNSSSAWSSWQPPPPNSSYLTIAQPAWAGQAKISVYVKATCYPSPDGAPIWTRSNFPPSGAPAGAGRAYRFVLLDDGTAVKLEVRAVG